ncbi:MAG: FAD-dependent oxidoreductase, partial [Actinobacteria bacterium]|nr:FAD-dependent oxidoreductase [Actinomycetota bacterium]
MKITSVDVLIIGGGPAGLAAAIELKKLGIKDVRIIEREAQAGGVPRHSNHPGYGLRDLYR